MNIPSEGFGYRLGLLRRVSGAHRPVKLGPPTSVRKSSATFLAQTSPTVFSQCSPRRSPDPWTPQGIPDHTVTATYRHYGSSTIICVVHFAALVANAAVFLSRFISLECCPGQPKTRLALRLPDRPPSQPLL